MYIWIGCKLPEEFEQEIRNHCLALNEKIGLDTVAFSLPQHISLKISFRSARYQEIIEDLTIYLAAQKPFSLRIRAAEQAGRILWMPVAENPQLRRLHRELDARLENRFGIGQHEFDRCFLFHSTLFIDSDVEKVAEMAAALADYPIERKLVVDSFLLGISENGEPGSYRVVAQIQI